jgi:hypothetical protein
MRRPEITSQDGLRDCILRNGHRHFVSMADVQSRICGGLLDDLSIERQQLVVDTVRSLLEDGLVVVGDIPGRNDPGFKLDLTATGQQVSNALVGHAPD